MIANRQSAAASRQTTFHAGLARAVLNRENAASWTSKN